MQSKEYEDTFRRASSLIVARHGAKDVQAILDDVRKRASHSSEPNPVKNRHLFLEASKASQMIGVREKDYCTVVEELKKLNLVHVWARATCPNSTGDVIVETDDRSKFLKKLTKPCLHCGQSHLDLPQEQIETVYALNFQLSQDKMPLAELLLLPNAPPINRREGWFNWIRKNTPLFQKRDGSPVEQAADLLDKNRSAKKPIGPESVLLFLSRLSLYWLVLTLVIALPLAYYVNLWIGVLVAITSTVLVLTLATFAWIKLYNAYAVQKNILFFSFLISSSMITGGVLGLKFDFKARVEDAEVGEWPKTKVEKFGAETTEPNPWLICVGGLVIIVGMAVCGRIHERERIAEISTT